MTIKIGGKFRLGPPQACLCEHLPTHVCVQVDADRRAV